MEPNLHGLCPLNCQDLLSWLPSNLAFFILSFLDPVSLCRASQVCRIWYHMANDCRLWMKFCRLRVWQLSQTGEDKQRNKHVSVDGRIMWKAMFSERFRIRRNWLKGFCNVRTFEGHTQGISCIQFDDTRIVSGSWDKTIRCGIDAQNTAWAALTLTGHSGTVRCLHLHDNRLVSGSSDRTIKVLDLSTDNVNWVWSNL
ncbi:Probable E3 ubiquitin ligase complex SCF subunit sconB [Geodia barretti]|uniref:Probable E3 ubiquitin ligase complex SCF subunit sconB n=1 Tax=Geodia barretti TaxID=519541 RepID=A0AA35XAD9_GEOBA|nr:Probable E3 ubiquitin ligase complex SCF subunit sconB [Geodia barretti]